MVVFLVANGLVLKPLSLENNAPILEKKRRYKKTQYGVNCVDGIAFTHEWF
jgi:hypothetical protein